MQRLRGWVLMHLTFGHWEPSHFHLGVFLHEKPEWPLDSTCGPVIDGCRGWRSKRTFPRMRRSRTKVLKGRVWGGERLQDVRVGCPGQGIQQTSSSCGGDKRNTALSGEMPSRGEVCLHSEFRYHHKGRECTRRRSRSSGSRTNASVGRSL